MSKVINLSDIIDAEKLTTYQLILLQALKDSVHEDIDATQFIILGLSHSFKGKVQLIYQFDNQDEESLIMAKGYLDVLQSQATKQLEKPDD